MLHLRRIRALPPEFRGTGRRQQHNWIKDPLAPGPFDEVSPLAISESEFRNDNRLLAGKVGQASCRLDTVRPVPHQSMRFDVLREPRIRPPGGQKDYCSRCL